MLDQEQRTQIAELYHYIFKDNNLVEVVSEILYIIYRLGKL
jgi:hypothetical protein